MLNIYITSTEENTTRYLISTGLAITMKSLGYSVGYYKPVLMNCENSDGRIFSKELDFLHNADPSIEIINSYYFGKHPNPLLASAKEGQLINPEQLQKDFKTINNRYECNITDGIDGLGTPLNVDFTEENLITAYNQPLLFIISPQKSSMNSAIMSINHAKTAGIDVRGVILNDYPDTFEDENIKLMPRFIEEYTDTKLLGVTSPLNENIPPQELIDTILNSIDLEAVFNIKIEKLEI